MIEPGKEDIGKDVVINFGHTNRGIITSYNKKFVYVKVKEDGQPQAIKRKFLQWSREGLKINQSYAMF